MQNTEALRHNVNLSEISEIKGSSSVQSDATQIQSFGAPEYTTNATDYGGPTVDPYQKYIEICQRQNEDIDDFILHDQNESNSSSKKNQMKLIMTEIDEVSLDYSMSLDQSMNKMSIDTLVCKFNQVEHVEDFKKELDNQVLQIQVSHTQNQNQEKSHTFFSRPPLYGSKVSTKIMKGSLVVQDNQQIQKVSCDLGGYKLNSEQGAILDELINLDNNKESKKVSTDKNMKVQKMMRKTILQNNLGVLEKEKSKIKQDHQAYKQSKPVTGDISDNMKRIQMNIMQHTADLKVKRMVETKILAITQVQDVTVETLGAIEEVSQESDLEKIKMQSSMCSMLISGLDDLPVMAFDLNQVQSMNISKQKVQTSSMFSSETNSENIGSSVGQEQYSHVKNIQESFKDKTWTAKNANPEEQNVNKGNNFDKENEGTFDQNHIPQDFINALNTVTFTEPNQQMTGRSYGTQFSTIFSEGTCNVPKDMAAKDLMKKNFEAIQKFKSIEIRPYVSESSDVWVEEPIYQVDFDNYLERLGVVADKINEFWQEVKTKDNLINLTKYIRHN